LVAKAYDYWFVGSKKNHKSSLGHKYNEIVKQIWLQIFFAYVKDEGSNFNVMLIALTFVFSCESFWLEHSF
jgi:hypothetical protein